MNKQPKRFPAITKKCIICSQVDKYYARNNKCYICKGKLEFYIDTRIKNE